jgi:hypothetical protein
VSLGALLFISFTSCNSVLGRTKATEVCSKIPEKEYFEDRFECLKQVVTSKDQPLQQKEKAFASLMNYWQRRDGMMGFSLSDIFLEILTADPNFFFSHMKDYREDYDVWLENLGQLSFVWFNEGPSPLEERRVELIAFLEGISISDKTTGDLRNRLIAELKGIKPREID